jgi:hypothetical protein
MSRDPLRRWAGLALGLAGMGLASLALSHASGGAGPVVAESRERGLESDAYFYTEVGDVGAFLEDDGRYGRQSTSAE